jgi:hypothetical protein
MLVVLVRDFCIGNELDVYYRPPLYGVCADCLWRILMTIEGYVDSL